MCEAFTLFLPPVRPPAPPRDERPLHPVHARCAPRASCCRRARRGGQVEGAWGGGKKADGVGTAPPPPPSRRGGALVGALGAPIAQQRVCRARAACGWRMRAPRGAGRREQGAPRVERGKAATPTWARGLVFFDLAPPRQPPLPIKSLSPGRQAQDQEAPQEVVRVGQEARGRDVPAAADAAAGVHGAELQVMEKTTRQGWHPFFLLCVCRVSTAPSPHFFLLFGKKKRQRFK